ncbi:MAG: tetratricopeptide repeat protein [Chitinophagales bacterium]|nr:tetratricopeptide repeat protein [Chitinophagales bacterium]MDW8418564.1 tetratricopeptide repeat protein [Chitinophagales bacterium]
MSKPKKEIDLLAERVITEAAMLAYIGNRMSAEERARFEKLLQNDPFAAEALEGLATAGATANCEMRIAHIRNKIRERAGIREARNLRLHWTVYAYAAAVLGVLLGIGFLLIQLINRPDNSLAMQNNGAAAETPIISDSLVGLPQASDSVLSISAPFSTSNSNLNQSQAPGAVIAPTGTYATPPAGELQTSFTVTEKAKLSLQQEDNTERNDKSFPISSDQEFQSKMIANGNAPSPEAKTNNNAPPVTDKEGDLLKEPAKADGYYSYETSNRIVRSERASPPTMDEAMRNFNSGNYKQSAELFDELLKQYPDNADALYFGGISEYILGNTKKSEKNFDKLLKTNRYNEGSKWYKANILLKKGNKAEAKKLLEEIAQGNSSYKERALNKLEELR